MSQSSDHRLHQRIVLAIVVAITSGWILLMATVGLYPSAFTGQPADCALVLGAAVWDGKPSPVYRERLNFAVDLYRTGKVRYVVTTGGVGDGDDISEGEVGQRYVVQNGVPIERTTFEGSSRTTLENLVNAKAEVDRLGIQSCVVVSDPLHLKRATAMASDLGYSVVPGATPTTMYRSFGPKFGLLWSETYYLFQYYISGR